MEPIQNFVSSVVAEVVRRQPASTARTNFAWQLAVGPALARVTNVELSDGILVVRTRDPRWKLEIERAKSTVLPRLQHLLGPQNVTRIDAR